MTDQFQRLMKDTRRWSLWLAALLIGLPVLILLVVVGTGFCGVSFDVGIAALLRYIQIPAQLLGPGHVENQLLTPKTASDWLIVPAFYVLLAFCGGLAFGLFKTKREK